MKKHKVSYKSTKFFSGILEDYLEQKIPNLFFNRFPSIDNIDNQIEEKKKQNVNRDILSETLVSQNQGINLSKVSRDNILLLKQSNTYTVTTGHQLCLFGGPLYFLYKILSTINLTERLSSEYPEYNFVPIFWMASEDHDVEEINHIHLFGKRYEWETNNRGMVGEMDTSSVVKIIAEIQEAIGDDNNGCLLIQLFKEAYDGKNLADATRFLVNELFGKYGLVILDPNDIRFKQPFIPFVKQDILSMHPYNIIARTSEMLSEKYKVQALVRDINFFRLSDGKRDRILSPVDEKEIENSPESFSPNVLMRPLYQELILPNVAYIGGPAEIAYWMQLKDFFSQSKIVFPMLVLRNSVLMIQKEKYDKWMKLGFNIEDLFRSKQDLEKDFLRNKKNINLEKQKKDMRKLFTEILGSIKEEGLRHSIEADMTRQLKSLDKIEKKIIKFEKLRHNISLNQIRNIKDALFPKNMLQERFDSFIPYYLRYGEGFIATLKEELDPLDINFLVLCK